MQEVPRTVDRNPKTTTYLWYVSLPHAYRTLEGEMMGTLATLRRCPEGLLRIRCMCNSSYCNISHILANI